MITTIIPHSSNQSNLDSINFPYPPICTFRRVQPHCLSCGYFTPCDRWYGVSATSKPKPSSTGCQSPAAF
ncbi:hypothetical protein AFLA_002961 [Aspergillus flavus NRRL3357]|nr:hypothetical protein AFLA_002961 [Aspergillus flavus NRRL3357]